MHVRIAQTEWLVRPQITQKMLLHVTVWMKRQLASELRNDYLFNHWV